MYFSFSETDKLRDYSTLFSRKHGLSWMKCDFNSLAARIEIYDQEILNDSNLTYLDYLKKIYKIIEKKHPNEYVIKNSFINHDLIDEFRTGKSSIFNEFRVGKSIVDLAVFNGCSTAFEIKSEFDTPNRLEVQILNYKSIFNQVYLIVPESKLSLYEKYDKQVGIIIFSKNDKDKFFVSREASKSTNLNSNELTSVLRSNEYLTLVKRYYGYLPPMTSFNQFDTCRKLISKIPIEILNELFLSIIKARKKVPYLSKRNYKEFNQLSLALKLNKTEHAKVISNLKKQIKV